LKLFSLISEELVKKAEIGEDDLVEEGDESEDCEDIFVFY